ncbi:MAG: ribose-phosphate pyrophosphokinase [Spirochaetes bacterium]|nr:ribose-phosphate pyrophosphokinase [Spirochaetota bacterium]
MEQYKIFSGTANQALAREVANHLQIALGKITIKKFADNEIFVQIQENVRGKDVFLIQPTCNPGNYNLVELLIITDALRRASARRITLVVPYYGYARQDRKDRPHVPISAKLMANLMIAAGAHRLLTMDLHSDQIQGFFDIPVDNLFAASIFIENFSKVKDPKNWVVVSPDAGGIVRARFYAQRIGCQIAFIDKRRKEANVSEVMNVVGEVKNKKAILVDDIVDTAGTLCNAASAIKKSGAIEVFSCCTHAVLSGNAIDKIEKSVIKEMYVTDTIPLRKKSSKIKVLSVANMFAQAIYHIHIEKPLGELFLE